VTAPTCVVCERPTADGYACQHCGVTKPGEQLRQIADMVPAARDVAHRLSRNGGGGGASSKPGSRLPLDLTATAKLDGVQSALSTWARHVAEERGIIHAAAVINAGGISGVDGGAGEGGRSSDDTDDLVASALWLTGHCEWIRHRPEVDEFLTDIAAAARIVAGIARGPATQKYLGPCGADIELPAPTATDPNAKLRYPAECDGDIYARVYADGTVARIGECRTCRATVVTVERTAWLDGEVRSHAFRAAHIAQAYGIRPNTIRVWAARGLLVAHGHDREERPLYNVGDVLDLAATDAARRAEEQAKRERRAAAQAVKDERLSA
jgi:hypothetical protein